VVRYLPLPKSICWILSNGTTSLTSGSPLIVVLPIVYSHPEEPTLAQVASTNTNQS